MLAKTVALSTTALYYQGYIVAGKMADKLGDNGQPYRVKAKALKKAINKYFGRTRAITATFWMRTKN